MVDSHSTDDTPSANASRVPLLLVLLCSMGLASFSWLPWRVASIAMLFQLVVIERTLLYQYGRRFTWIRIVLLLVCIMGFLAMFTRGIQAITNVLLIMLVLIAAIQSLKEVFWAWRDTRVSSR